VELLVIKICGKYRVLFPTQNLKYLPNAHKIITYHHN